jgi:hypothetical protein
MRIETNGSVDDRTLTQPLAASRSVEAAACPNTRGGYPACATVGAAW